MGGGNCRSKSESYIYQCIIVFACHFNRLFLHKLRFLIFARDCEASQDERPMPCPVSGWWWSVVCRQVLESPILSRHLAAPASLRTSDHQTNHHRAGHGDIEIEGDSSLCYQEILGSLGNSFQPIYAAGAIHYAAVWHWVNRPGISSSCLIDQEGSSSSSAI